MATEKQLFRDLQTLIAFPTVSNRPNVELGAFFASQIEHLGFTVERFAHQAFPGKVNLVASIGPTGTDGLVLSGHMDVVPTEGQPWDSDPFVLTERGDKLYGRGTSDMKGFLAATLAALRRIPASSFSRELVLIWTHDEEVGCLGSALLAEQLADENRPLPKACWIGEPTGFVAQHMHPGHVALEIQLQGRAAHSSRPDLGVNAIHGAATVIADLQQLAHELAQRPNSIEGQEEARVAMNVAMIQGGSAINIVPDACSVHVGYRHLPGMAMEALYEEIQQRIANLSLGDVSTTCSFTRGTPSLLSPANNPLSDLLQPHCQPGPPSASFATDGGNLAKLGMQPVIFGPGSIEVAHKANEYIPTAELIASVNMIEDVIRRRCCS